MLGILVARQPQAPSAQFRTFRIGFVNVVEEDLATGFVFGEEGGEGGLGAIDAGGGGVVDGAGDVAGAEEEIVNWIIN